MADHLGISPSAYGKLERGETRIDIERLKQIADALEMDIIDFLENEMVVVTHHGDSSKSNNGVVIQPTYDSAEAWKQMATHLKEEVVILRKEKEQMMRMLEKFTT